MARRSVVTSISASTDHSRWIGDYVDFLEWQEEQFDIPTKSEIRKILAEETESIERSVASQSRKLAKMAEQAAAASKDAAAAREMVEKIVETAREVFSDVIEELLAPHYRRLAALAMAAGIEVPEETIAQIELSKKHSAVARNTFTVKTRTNQAKTTKKNAASSRTKSKGVKTCRKK